MAKIVKMKTPGIVGKLKGPASRHLGIDMGTHTIKVVELRTTARGTEIAHHVMAPTPPGGFQVSVLAAQLKEMLQEHRIKTKRVVVGLAGKGVAARRLILPSIPEDEVQEAIRWQAAELFPFSLGDAMLAFQVLPWDVGGDQAKQDVLVAAATRETVMEHIAVVQEAGLEPIGVMAQPHAVKQLWQRAELGKDEEGSIAVVDLGGHRTSIHIFLGGELQFSRHVPTSGDAFTMALTGLIRAGEQEIELHTAQGENLKRQHGIPAIDDRCMSTEGIPLSQLAVRMRPVLEKLETEVSRSFDYYAFQFQGAPITRLLLAGGGVQLKGIESFFAERFDVQVGFLDPLAPIVIHDSPAFSEVDEASRPTLTVAVGLALPLSERLNLLPVELQPHRKRWNVRALVAYAILGLLFLLPVAEYAWQGHRRVSSIRETVITKKKTLEGYRKILQEHARLQGQNSQLDAKLANLPELDLRIPPVAAAMRLISQKIPKDMALTNMDVKQGTGRRGLNVMLRGLVFGQKKEAFPVLTSFMEQLEAAPVFSEVELGSAGENEEGSTRAGLDFQITCRLK